MENAEPADAVIERIRALCLALPEAEEKPFGGHTAPSFRVRDKLFVNIREDLTGMICKAPLGLQQLLVSDDPARFYVPSYVGHHGWAGVRLDVPQDWDVVADVIENSYRLVAPKRLAAQRTRIG